MSTKSAKRAPSQGRRAKGFTEEEREAMKSRVQELNAGDEGGESVVLAKIAALQEPDRSLGKRLHEIVRAAAPALTPRLWYGMPAYGRDGKVVCHFQPATKFKTRYATIGFSDKANLDDGDFWPVAFALKGLSPAQEKVIVALVKKAAG